MGIIERLTLPARGKDAGRKNARSILRVGAALVGALHHLQVRTDLDPILMPISILCSFAPLKSTKLTFLMTRSDMFVACGVGVSRRTFEEKKPVDEEQDIVLPFLYIENGIGFESSDWCCGGLCVVDFCEVGVKGKTRFGKVPPRIYINGLSAPSLLYT